MIILLLEGGGGGANGRSGRVEGGDGLRFWDNSLCFTCVILVLLRVEMGMG